MNIDTLLINHCAPTLAGLKPGALLCFHRQGTMDEFKKTVDKYNHKFNKKGLYFRILFTCPTRTLLYVYRPKMICEYVRRKCNLCFLRQFGYNDSMTLTDMLNKLKERFSETGCFPHESGIFLGYPVEDVYGFIRNSGNHAKLCGEWKVYGDAQKAAEIFETYTRCRQDYINRFSVGIKLEELIVA